MQRLILMSQMMAQMMAQMMGLGRNFIRKGVTLQQREISSDRDKCMCIALNYRQSMALS